MIWVPRGFADAQAFLCFLAELPVMEVMELGRKVSLYQQQYVPKLLQKFNDNHRLEINQTYGIELPPIEEQEFHTFVGIGQMSRLHLAKFIHNQMLKALQAKADQLRSEFASASPERCSEISSWIESMNRLDLESVIDTYLKPEKIICA